MQGDVFPSGVPAAERRAAFAETLLLLGDVAGAVEVLSGALDLAPGWAAGWYRLGEWLEQGGDIGAAVSAWQRALAADPADPFGAALKCDLARQVPVLETMPAAFVERLFDQYAARFDTALRTRLDYRGPEQLARALDRAGGTRVARALDLGCGTGLCGEMLRPRCDWLTGYDLSAAMLREARDKGLYDQLDKRDITRLPPDPCSHDLIVAADVFIYVGALEKVIGWCRGALRPGGLLAFTVERGTRAVELRESRRFAHAPAYVSGLLRDAGFDAVTLTAAVLRRDRGAEVDGLVVSARAPGLRTDLQGDGDAVIEA